jgi:hypothetical protein
LKLENAKLACARPARYSSSKTCTYPRVSISLALYSILSHQPNAGHPMVRSHCLFAKWAVSVCHCLPAGANAPHNVRDVSVEFEASANANSFIPASPNEFSADANFSRCSRLNRKHIQPSHALERSSDLIVVLLLSALARAAQSGPDS